MELMGEVKMKYYKKARPDGWDFFTGKTINYRDNIGKTVTVPNKKGKALLCSDNVLHASWDPNCFVGAKIPCSVFIVSGKPVVKDSEKAGFRRLKIVEEISLTDFEKLVGWKVQEACNPIHPFKLATHKVTDVEIALLKNWASVWTSVGDSVWNSVGNSVRASVWDSVWTSVRASVEASVWTSVGDSVETSVWTSVGASVRTSFSASVMAYIGSLFPNIKQWKYIEHEKGKYPFQSCVDLWKKGLVPIFDGSIWRLHGSEKATVLATWSDSAMNIVSCRREEVK